MARAARIVWDFGLYHITIRGNNQHQVFQEGQDFDKYLEFTEEYKSKFKFKLYAFVLMPNHLHLLLETAEYGSISSIMKLLNQRYARWSNKKYERKGHLWESRFHSNIIDKDSYLLECIRYIELNPIRAKLVSNLKDYKWSSYHFHAYGIPSPILDSHPIFNELGKTPADIRYNYRKFIAEGLTTTDTPIQMVSDTK